MHLSMSCCTRHLWLQRVAALLLLLVLGSLLLIGASTVPCAKAANWGVEFPLAADLGRPVAIASNADASLWVATEHAIVPVSEGATQTAVGVSPNPPQSLAVSNDGEVWYSTDRILSIGRLRPSVSAQLPNELIPSMLAGSSGSVWFAASRSTYIPGSEGSFEGAVGRVAPDGVVSSFALDGENPRPTAISASSTGALVALTTGPATGARRSPELVSLNSGGITGTSPLPSLTTPVIGLAQSEKGIWLATGSGVSLLRADGKTKVVKLSPERHNISSLTLGPDGNIWFADRLGRKAPYRGLIGRITGRLQVTEFPLREGMVPDEIVSDGAKYLWFTDPGNSAVGRFPVGVPAVEIGRGRLAHGRAIYKLRLSCVDSGRGCHGDVRLTLRSPSNRSYRIGDASYRLSSDESQTWVLPLTSHDALLLERHPSWELTASVSVAGGQGAERLVR